VRWASDDMREQRISAVDCGIERKTTVKETLAQRYSAGRKKKRNDGITPPCVCDAFVRTK